MDIYAEHKSYGPFDAHLDLLDCTEHRSNQSPVEHLSIPVRIFVNASSLTRKMIVKEDEKVLASFFYSSLANDEHRTCKLYKLVEEEYDSLKLVRFEESLATMDGILLMPEYNFDVGEKVLPSGLFSFDASFERDLLLEALKGAPISTTSGIVIKVHREEGPYEYKVVGHKKMKTNADKQTNWNEFCFLIPEDRDILSDYMFVLIAQFKRGILRQKDLKNARRKNSFLKPGYLGLRCIHCGGNERGHYFPTSTKNLQAVPSMFHKHLLSCKSCPDEVKCLLKATKNHHKNQVMSRKSTATSFFASFWERNQNEVFDGGERAIAMERINELMVELSKRSAPKKFEGHENLSKCPKTLPSSSRSPERTLVVSQKMQDVDHKRQDFESKERQMHAKASKIKSPLVTSQADLDPLKVLDEVMDIKRVVVDHALLHDKIEWHNTGKTEEIEWDPDSLLSLRRFVNSDPDMMECIDLLLES